VSGMLLSHSFVENSTAPRIDEAQSWAYWHELGLREIRYRLAFPEEVSAEASLVTIVPARDAGDICHVCGQTVTWVDHLPPLHAGDPVRCFVNVRSLRPVESGERLVDGQRLYSADWL